MTGIAKKTVMRVLVEVGEVCADYQDRTFRNLRSRRLQLDEMWSWIFCQEKNRTERIARKNPDAGDIWLWTSVDADSKLVPTWRLGQRDVATATDFVSDLAKRVKGRVQLTTDALKVYVMSPRIRKRGFLITRRFESESSSSSPKRSGGSLVS
jgi:IS1 family transposase